MIAVIAGHIGRIHHAVQHPALKKTRPCYCFVPEECFDSAGWNRGRYLISRWPSCNCSANPLAIGSHVIPDPERPANIRSRCPILKKFITRLETVATIKIPHAAA